MTRHAEVIALLAANGIRTTYDGARLIAYDGRLAYLGAPVRPVDATDWTRTSALVWLGLGPCQLARKAGA